MMTSGSGVNYRSMFDAGSQIIAREGFRSFFKGAGANILRGIAGGAVLPLYDKLQAMILTGSFRKVSMSFPTSFNFRSRTVFFQGSWWLDYSRISVECMTNEFRKYKTTTQLSYTMCKAFVRSKTSLLFIF